MLCRHLKAFILKDCRNSFDEFSAGRHSEEPWFTSSLFRKVIKFSWFFAYLCPNTVFLHHKYAKKGLYKEFAQHGSFVCILWIIEVVHTYKTNIKIALKSRSYILNLGHVKLSLGIFFFLSCLTKGLYTSFQDLPFFWSKTHTRKPQILCFA